MAQPESQLRPRSHVMRPVAAVGAILAVLAALVLTGCGGGGSTAASPSPSPALR
jgi:hypothetical protein